MVDKGVTQQVRILCRVHTLHQGWPMTAQNQEEIEEEVAIDFPVHLQDLDECELGTLFESRAHTLRTMPFFSRGAFRAAMRMSMEEIVSGCKFHDEAKQERGWKLFFFFPRMLLSRPCRGGLVPRKKLETRFQKFFVGNWLDLISYIEKVSRQASRVFGRGGGKHVQTGTQPKLRVWR